MESTTRYKQLIVVVVAAITCVLLSSFVASSAQVIDSADAYPPDPGVGVEEGTFDLLERPTSFSPSGIGDEYEPDDTIDQASEIVVAISQTHVFKPEADEDWTKFRAWGCIKYTIETFDLSAINDTYLWLYDADGGPYLAHDDNSGGEPGASRIIWTASTRGTYFIKAQHATFDGGDGFDYNLQVIQDEVSECYSDGYEPDNTPADAEPITVDGQEQEHNFQGPCGGDVDWVKFSAISGTVYSIQTANLNLDAGNDTIIGLYQIESVTDTTVTTVTVDGHEMVNDDSENPPASQLDWLATESGTYYVKMEPFNPCFGRSDLTYRVKVVTSPTPPDPFPIPDPDGDAYEPDNVAGDANLIIVNGGAQQGRTIHEAGDEDWVKFWALAGNEYTIQTGDLGTGNNTVLYLYDTDMSLLAENDDIDPPPPPVDRASRIVWTSPANGTYYVKVEHVNPEMGTPSLSYSLQVTDTATCRDAFEEDDEWNQAQPITVDGSPQLHNFHNPCACDCAINQFSVDAADWVKFDAHAGVTYTIRTFDLGGYNDTMIGLYDNDGVPVEEDERPVFNDDARPDNLLVSEIVWTAPDYIVGTEVYRVKVSPFDRRIGGCDVDYYLEVTTDEYTLDVNIVGSGSVARSLPPPYHHYDNVVLTATAESGWTFDEWSGDLSGSANPDTISMHDGDKVVTATFTRNEYTLDVNIDGDGDVDVTPLKSFYYYGDEVTLDADANPGWSFGGWSGDLSGSDDPKTITITSNMVVTATFDEGAYILTVDTSGNGSVDKYPDQPTYGYGAVVTLTAVADSGWSFGGWSGALSGSDSPKPITMDGDKNVTATFTQDEYILTVNVDPVGKGLVTKNPDQATYQYGAVVTLTATTIEFWWEFAGWSGALTSTNATVTVTMDSSKIITATFSPPAYIYLPLVLRDWPPNTAPYTPSNPSPANGAMDQSSDVDLSWSGGDPDGDTVTYDVYFGTTTPPPLVKNNHATTTYDPGTLDYETEYHWYIVARDSRGAESEGPVWSFTTGEPTCLPAPTSPTCEWCEPNHSFTYACGPLCSGVSYSTYMCSGDLKDNFYIEITTQNRITIDLNVPDGVDYDLYLYDSMEQLVDWSEAYGSGVDEQVEYDPPTTGKYYIMVYAYSGTSNTNPYILNVTY